MRHTWRGASVLVLAPDSERGRVLAMGAQWSNLTAAEEATAGWAARYRHSSGNPRGYELFCLQRWLMLWEALRSLDLSANSAIAVLDDDMLLYRSANAWLRELGSSPLHANSQTAGVMGVAFQLHSPGTLRRFHDYLRWLYGLPTSKLARELDRFAVSRPLAALSVRQRHMLAHGLVAAANRSLPGHYWHFSDVQAMDSFCKRSAEGQLPEASGVRCALVVHERVRIDGAPTAYADQPSNCSALYLAPAGPGSVLQFTLMARSVSPHVASGAAASVRQWDNVSVATHWASTLRWKAGTPFAPGLQRGQLHGLCLAHLQGPRSKELFMEPLTAPSRRMRARAPGAPM